nr:hypothetical protein CFP56_70108 [Quercus suber]
MLQCTSRQSSTLQKAERFQDPLHKNCWLQFTARKIQRFSSPRQSGFNQLKSFHAKLCLRVSHFWSLWIWLSNATPKGCRTSFGDKAFTFEGMSPKARCCAFSMLISSLRQIPSLGRYKSLHEVGHPPLVELASLSRPRGGEVDRRCSRRSASSSISEDVPVAGGRLSRRRPSLHLFYKPSNCCAPASRPDLHSVSARLHDSPMQTTSPRVFQIDSNAS